MATMDIVMFVFLGLVLVGGLSAFFIANAKKE